jgi:hypothetical protein
MGNDSKFKIPEECRGFGEGNLDERLKVARSFIKTFAEKVAPPKSVDDSDGAWTQSIRRRFFEICPEDCYALPDAPWNRRGEFLADVTWAEIDREKRILLACEIEWGTSWQGKTHWSHVSEAFEKLLPVKAPFKVFIFSSDYTLKGPDRTAKGDSSIEFAKEKLKLSLENYGHHLPGEVYILIDFPQTRIRNGNGKYRSFIWTAKKLGRAEVNLEGDEVRGLKRPTESYIKLT